MLKGIWMTVALGLVSIIVCVSVSEYLGVINTIAVLVLMTGFIIITILAPHIFSISRISLVSVLVHSQLIFIVLPSLWLVGSIRSEFASRATVAASLSLFLVSASASVVSLGTARKYAKKSAIWDWAQRRGSRIESRITPWICTVLLGISLITVAYYVAVAPFIPLITMIRYFGSSINLLSMRETSFKLLSIPNIARYVIEWTRSVFWPFLTCIAMARWAVTRKRRQLVAPLILILMGLFITGATTEKAPVVYFLLAIILVHVFMQGRLKTKIITIGMSIVPIFPLMVYLFDAISKGAGSPFMQALINLCHRLLVVPARVAMIHYEVFPQYVDFLCGTSINCLAQVQGKALFPLSNFLYVNFYPWGIPDNPSGYANAVFSSEMWANFGWAGIIVTSLLLGWFLQVVNIWIWAFKKTPTIVATYSVMVMSVFSLISTNVTVFLITKGFFILCLIAWLAGRRNIHNEVRHATTILSNDT